MFKALREQGGDRHFGVYGKQDLYAAMQKFQPTRSVLWPHVRSDTSVGCMTLKPKSPNFDAKEQKKGQYYRGLNNYLYYFRGSF